MLLLEAWLSNTGRIPLGRGGEGEKKELKKKIRVQNMIFSIVDNACSALERSNAILDDFLLTSQSPSPLLHFFFEIMIRKKKGGEPSSRARPTKNLP